MMTTMKSATQQLYVGGNRTLTSSDSALRRHRWKIAALLALLAIGGGGSYVLMKPAAAPAVAAKPATPASTLTVTTAKVEQGTVPRSLLVTGSLAARDELPIGTETAELAIAEVLVDVGDHVKQGQLLARFDSKVLTAQRQQAQANLDEAVANAAAAVADARRADELVKNGWISGKDYDSRRANAQTMEARVGVAKANLAFADAKLRQAEIHAPSDGTITSRSAHIGAVVSGGEMFRMIREDRVELIAELPETDLSLVKAGQPITLIVDGAANKSANGVVRLVEPTVDVKTRIGRVRIDVTDGQDIKPGMFVTGQLQVGKVSSLIVPEKAVIYKNGEPNVLVVDQTSKVELRPITVGPRDQGHIAVLSGVQAGENVAVRGANYLKSGDQVTVVEAPAETGAGPTKNAN